MKVILVNGSPHEKGCTYTALKEVASALEQEGIETDIFWIGTKAIAGCIACHGCAKTGRCVFHDKVNEFLELAPVYDGYIFGSPVHWAAAGGAITSFMDRVFQRFCAVQQIVHRMKRVQRSSVIMSEIRESMEW